MVALENSLTREGQKSVSVRSALGLASDSQMAALNVPEHFTAALIRASRHWGLGGMTIILNFCLILSLCSNLVVGFSVGFQAESIVLMSF